MRFFEYWKGFVWEYTSVGDYLKCLVARFLGLVVGILLAIGFFMLFSNY